MILSDLLFTVLAVMLGNVMTIVLFDVLEWAHAKIGNIPRNIKGHE